MESTLNTLNWYAEQAERTYCFQEEVVERARNIQVESRLGKTLLTEDRSQRLMHGILGMSGEAGEITSCNSEADNFEDSLWKEIGDWMWYFATAAKALDKSIARIFTSGSTIHRDQVMHITISSNAMIESLKKWLYYGKPMDLLEIEKAMLNACAWIWEMAGYDEANMQDILKGNIEKLQKRFPDKFTAADAIARVDA